VDIDNRAPRIAGILANEVDCIAVIPGSAEGPMVIPQPPHHAIGSGSPKSSLCKYYDTASVPCVACNGRGVVENNCDSMPGPSCWPSWFRKQVSAVQGVFNLNEASFNPHDFKIRSAMSYQWPEIPGESLRNHYLEQVSVQYKFRTERNSSDSNNLEGYSSPEPCPGSPIVDDGALEVIFPVVEAGVNDETLGATNRMRTESIAALSPGIEMSSEDATPASAIESTPMSGLDAVSSERGAEAASSLTSLSASPDTPAVIAYLCNTCRQDFRTPGLLRSGCLLWKFCMMLTSSGSTTLVPTIVASSVHSARSNSTFELIWNATNEPNTERSLIRSCWSATCVMYRHARHLIRCGRESIIFKDTLSGAENVRRNIKRGELRARDRTGCLSGQHDAPYVHAILRVGDSTGSCTFTPLSIHFLNSIVFASIRS
jgi:hypothetical protein